jgi:hypothetical protein
VTPGSCPATAAEGPWVWGADYCQCINPLESFKDCASCQANHDTCSNGFCPSSGQCLFGSSSEFHTSSCPPYASDSPVRDVAHAHTHAHSHAYSHLHVRSHRRLVHHAHTSAPVSDCLGCCGAAGPSAPAGCPATPENGSWAWGAQYCECVNPLATAKDCKTCESTFDVCSNGFCPSTGQCLFGSSCTCASARGVCLCYCSDEMWCAACGMALRVGAAGPQSPASCPTTPLNGTWAWGADACSCVDPGTTFTSCGECESLSCSTGWCSDSKTCMYGSSAPVSPGFCNPQDYITSSGDC